jgi:hypothetical protein
MRLQYKAWPELFEWLVLRAAVITATRTMKLITDRPYANVDTAMRKLLELANALEADHAGRLSVGTLNNQMMATGASAAEYGAAMKAAIAHGYFTMHPSGGYVTFTQAGADLFA